MISRILTEELHKVLLMENKQSKIDSKASAQIQSILNISDEQMQSTFVDQNGNTHLSMNGKPKTYRDILLKDAVTQEYITPLLAINTEAYKFEIGACRILYGECNLYSLQPDQTKCYNLKRILRILAQSHCDEYTGNFEPIENGKVVGTPLVLEALEDRFLGEVKQQSDNERDNVNNYQYQQNKVRYNIVHIPDYETSHQYEQYTNPNSRWCLTYNEQHWKSYNPDGSKKIYFALQDGFENIPCEEGQNFPLDEYGLSMLCIQIDENGNMTQCTSRWNHEGTHDNEIRNADQIMNTMEVSKVLGGSVFKLCPPYTKEELIGKGIIPFSMMQDLLNQGKEIEWQSRKKSGLDNKIWVKYRNRWNLLNTETNQLLCKQWWSYVCDFKEGFAVVQRAEDDLWNFIKPDGQVLCAEWFEVSSKFNEGLAQVKRKEDGLWNFIKPDGQPLCDEWWKCIYNFHEGFAMVQREEDGLWNFIKKDGQPLCAEWWYNVDMFSGGLAPVQREEDYLWNFIKPDGQVLCDEWWQKVYNFHEGLAPVQRAEDDLWNFFNTEGDVICRKWFKEVDDFSGGFARVYGDSNVDFIDKNGVCYDIDKNPIQKSKQSIISRLLREEIFRIKSIL